MQVHPVFPRRLLTLLMSFAFTGFSADVLADTPVMMTEQPYSFMDAIKYGKSLTSFRPRYETVSQEAFQPAPNNTEKLDRAHAFTMRSLVGWQTAPYQNFSVAAQITDVHEFNHQFNDRRNNLSERGKAHYPNIVDPSFTDINQLFVDWTGVKNTKVRVGRQILNLDNVRFIGDIAFRQNTQVFDGITVVNKSIPNTELTAAHFEQVRQINTQLRQGNIDILHAKYRISPTESLVGYGYLVDVANLSQNGQAAAGPNALSSAVSGGNGLGPSQDMVKGANTDASNQTFGLRLDGTRAINTDWKAVYTAEYAKQDDFAGGDKRIDAHYFKLGGGINFAGWTVRLDHEKLASNNGQYAFQTPLGTNHLFQGWSDHFLATPKQGIEDSYVTISGAIEKVKVYAEYHVMKADEKYASINGRLGQRYGTEFDASLTYALNKELMTKFEYAKFNEQDVYGGLFSPVRKGDKEIVWLTAMYSF